MRILARSTFKSEDDVVDVPVMSVHVRILPSYSLGEERKATAGDPLGNA